MTPSPSLAAATLAAGLLGALQAPVPPVADVVEHVAAPVSPAYWTPERMARAIPIDLRSAVRQVEALTASVLPPSPRAGYTRPPEQRRRPGRVGSPGRVRQAAAPAAMPPATTSGSQWAAGGSVTRTTGRVFLTMNGVDFVCSASAVRGASRDLVATAGHCVKDGTGGWAENWTFVPGYRQGRQPYGSYPARRMFVAGPWSRGADDDYDVGMVAVTTSGGRHLADVVGAQEIGFDARRGLRTYGFGFPADPPYDGERLLYCAGTPHGDPQRQTGDQGLRCDLTAGASGGPWLSGFDPATGRGTLVSVSSFKYSNDHGTMYGPYFGPAVKDLFRTAERA
ncbi:serine protease [Microbispora sp. NPDC049125]|uniref:trypsin-like serine peptidase n=1 Tax=Microbispora sp. NPDC049125 TaxID=3154929 RepID=UPI003466ED47